MNKDTQPEVCFRFGTASVYNRYTSERTKIKNNNNMYKKKKKIVRYFSARILCYNVYRSGRGPARRREARRRRQ